MVCGTVYSGISISRQQQDSSFVCIAAESQAAASLEAWIVTGHLARQTTGLEEPQPMRLCCGETANLGSLGAWARADEVRYTHR